MFGNDKGQNQQDDSGAYISKWQELRSKMLRPFNSRQYSLGSSLPSVLIAAGIMGIVAAGMGQVYKTSFRAQKRVENNQERTRIADSLVQRVDCKKTFAGVTPGTCPGGVNGVIALKDASNNIFISGTGNASKIGDWAIKANCNSAAGEVSVNIAASKSAIPIGTDSGDSLFIKDPLNEQLLDWSHGKSSLFLSGTGLCRSHFSAGSGLCDASTEGNTRYNSVKKQLEFCNGTDWVTPGDGSTDTLIVDAGRDVVTSCSGKVERSAYCRKGSWQSQIIFKKHFTSPPEVVVSLNHGVYAIGVSPKTGNGHCDGGGIDAFVASASNVTSAGFLLNCNVSPKSECSAYDGVNAPGKCSWIAVGSGLEL